MKSEIDKKRAVLEALEEASPNDKIIDEVYEVLYPERSIEFVHLEQLPVLLKHKLEKAMDDYKQGRYISNDQMKEKMQKRLNG
jgi:hypothetical protein